MDGESSYGIMTFAVQHVYRLMGAALENCLGFLDGCLGQLHVHMKIEELSIMDKKGYMP